MLPNAMATVTDESAQNLVGTKFLFDKKKQDEHIALILKSMVGHTVSLGTGVDYIIYSGTGHVEIRDSNNLAQKIKKIFRMWEYSSPNVVLENKEDVEHEETEPFHVKKKLPVMFEVSIREKMENMGKFRPIIKLSNSISDDDE